MTEHNCTSCIQVYQGSDLKHRCRLNGLIASKANSDDCKRYEREPGSDDEVMVWFKGGWCIERKEVR